MKIAFKNFLTTLRRYKTASALNIAGLTMAFTAFYVMMAQVTYDLGYDRSFPESDRLYTVVPHFYRDSYVVDAPADMFPSVVEQCPEVELGGRMTTDRLFDVQKKGNETNRFKFVFNYVTESIVDLLGFRAVEGDLRGMFASDGVIVSRSVAEKMKLHAGDIVLVPDSPDYGDRNFVEVVVTGICEDFPDNSFLAGARVFRPFRDDISLSRCMFRLREGATADNFAAVWNKAGRDKHLAFLRYMDPDFDVSKIDELYKPALICVQHDIYFDSDVDFVEHGSFSAIVTGAAIALIVVIVAFINFVNFFMALIPVRLRAVNVCKVFGAPTRTLRLNFLLESVMFVLCALLFTMWISIALPETPLADYVSRPLSLVHNLGAAGLLLAMGLVMAVVSAVYPAWYITSFNASLAAKGGFSGSVSGRRMRTVLLGAQFCVSMALIIVTACMWMQYRYMVRYDVGIDRENLLGFELPSKHDLDDCEYRAVIDDGMRSIAGISGVTYANQPMVSDGSSVRTSFTRNGYDIELYLRYVTHDFPEVMGIPVVAGNGFIDEYDDSATQYCLMGDAARRKYGFEIGETVNNATIVGFVRDVAGNPLDQQPANVVYVAWGSAGPHVYFRTEPNTDVGRVVDDVRALLKERLPDFEPEIEFFDAEMERLYEKTRRNAFVIGLFAMMAVVISLMGVFGIVLFETQHRRREIAVRRVFGASSSELLRMFNRRYVIMVAVCFIVAAPVAWYVADRWLEGFARRAPLPWWIFAAAFAVVMALTVGLVTARSRAAAGENPARVLGGE